MYQVRHLDTSLLEDDRYAKFIAKQPAGTLAYFPHKAAETAQEMYDLVHEIAKPSWLLDFNIFMAIKAVNEKWTINESFRAGCGADVATPEEARYVQWASRKGRTSPNIEHSNVGASREEIFELIIKRGITSFVVDKPTTLRWIAQAKRKLESVKGPRPDSREIRVTLRITRTSGGADQREKFGALPQETYRLAVYAQKLGIPVAGLACHTGTENSFANLHPQKYGINRQPPVEGNLFDNYALFLKEIAPLWNQLRREGLIGNLLNTEGGYRPAYAEPEFDWRSVMLSQAQAIAEAFDGPVSWKIEPGRAFAPTGVMKVLVNNVDTRRRTGGKYRYVWINVSLYAGLHDCHWYPMAAFRATDLRKGNLYQFHTHPDMFQRYNLVGPACAGSDHVGKRDARMYVNLPKDLRPGEELVLLPAGAYTASLGPQAYLEMYGITGIPTFGFNGLRWPNVVSYPY